jgi:hypothetical protein
MVEDALVVNRIAWRGVHSGGFAGGIAKEVRSAPLGAGLTNLRGA